tara:strand:+ start:129 stop:542 length:414 start_codon:yes stop_codon:yes gene_type:complete
MRHSLNTKIHGIGVDIVEVKRMKDAIDKHGDKFATRILSTSEYDKYLASPNKAQYLAKCWAVKEAFVKAIGTGFKGNFLWKNITYFSPSGSLGLGHPQVRYSDEIKNDSLMSNKTVHLSVSDEQSVVIAYVTIEAKT